MNCGKKACIETEAISPFRKGVRNTRKKLHVNKKNTNADIKVANTDLDVVNADFDLTSVDIEAPTDGNAVAGGVYENPLSDSGFKKLLASTNSLTNFLNGVMRLDKEREITKLSFKTKRISYQTSDAEGAEKKTWCFDIRAQTNDGRNIDVEVQNLQHNFFEDRVLTYGSALMLKAKAELDATRADDDKKMVATRTPPELTSKEKEERRQRAYELPDTVSIWVCNFAVPTGSIEPWDSWMLYSENDLKNGKPLPISNRLKYIFLQLPNFKKQADELESVEDQWSYVLKHAFTSKAEIKIKNDAVAEALDRIRKTEKESDMITKEERECTIASIQYNARMERERLENTIAVQAAELDKQAAELAALRAENARLKAAK